MSSLKPVSNTLNPLSDRLQTDLYACLLCLWQGEQTERAKPRKRWGTRSSRGRVSRATPTVSAREDKHHCTTNRQGKYRDKNHNDWHWQVTEFWPFCMIYWCRQSRDITKYITAYAHHGNIPGWQKTPRMVGWEHESLSNMNWNH